MTKMYLSIVDSLHDLEPLMEKMEKEEKIWEKLEVCTNQSEGLKNDKEGIYHIFRKL
jgi:hypothetical protein